MDRNDSTHDRGSVEHRKPVRVVRKHSGGEDRTDLVPPEVQTPEQLREYLGVLSPEEKALLDQPLVQRPPTPEELELLGPDFRARAEKRARTSRDEKG